MNIKTPDINDYEKVMKYLEDAYGHSYNYFSYRYPHVSRKENIDFDNILIIEENEKICSLVRIFPILTIQNQIELKFGGIGSVSTAYEERGKGYMSILMQEAIKKMKKDGYELSILWGDRHRYKNFGYEIGGKVVLITITTRGLEKMNISSVKTKRYLNEEKILEKIIKNYNERKYRIKRDENYFKDIYKIYNTALYYSEQDDKFGYVVIETSGFETRVYEQAGDETLILGILKYLSERFGKRTFTLEFPNFEEIPEKILEASSGWSIIPAGMIKIINLRKLVELYKNLIGSQLEEGEDIIFEIENKEKAGIKKEKNKLKIVEEGKNVIKLKEEEMVRLFFNVSGSGLKIGGVFSEKIKKIFPIEIYFPFLDHI
ncbi:MAG: GNAT family N-acetyltransferase [Candidatus Omnitrophica bacterium]|nr:GNAT family N-acetyltransferase [Candidatus Omnitrophota bacterium]